MKHQNVPDSTEDCSQTNDATADCIGQDNVFSSTVNLNQKPVVGGRRHVLPSPIKKITPIKSESTLMNEQPRSCKAEVIDLNSTQQVFEVCLNLDEKIKNEDIVPAEKAEQKPLVKEQAMYREADSSNVSSDQRAKRKREDIMAGNCKKRLNFSGGTDKTKQHQCAHCSYGTSNSSNFSRHSLIHTGKKPFQCGICEQEFIKNKSYKIHLKKHGYKFPFECAVCHEGFENPDALKVHENRSKLYQCDVCKKTFKHRKDYLVKHMRTHLG